MESIGILSTVAVIAVVILVLQMLLYLYSLLTFRRRTEKLYRSLPDSQDATHLGLELPASLRPLPHPLRRTPYCSVWTVN